ncbi:MAG: hypothetical protein SXQ77_05910 [Halobacteria archaeon]|nr:hypothetical protein [Halobacteria archaeon]
MEITTVAGALAFAFLVVTILAMLYITVVSVRGDEHAYSPSEKTEVVADD